jgi:hypothetical protein
MLDVSLSHRDTLYENSELYQDVGSPRQSGCSLRTIAEVTRLPTLETRPGGVIGLRCSVTL